jgi:hypothetical protein
MISRPDGSRTKQYLQYDLTRHSPEVTDTNCAKTFSPFARFESLDQFVRQGPTDAEKARGLLNGVQQRLLGEPAGLRDLDHGSSYIHVIHDGKLLHAVGSGHHGHGRTHRYAVFLFGI